MTAWPRRKRPIETWRKIENHTEHIPSKTCSTLSIRPPPPGSTMKLSWSLITSQLKTAGFSTGGRFSSISGPAARSPYKRWVDLWKEDWNFQLPNENQRGPLPVPLVLQGGLIMIQANSMGADYMKAYRGKSRQNIWKTRSALIVSIGFLPFKRKHGRAAWK